MESSATRWSSVAKIGDSISLFLSKLAGVCLVTMICLTGFDVFSRYILNKPLLFSDEMGSFLLVALAFLGASQTLKEDKHIKVEVIVSRLPFKIQLFVSCITTSISFIVLSIFSWHCSVMVYYSYVRGVKTPSILLSPVWIPQLIMLVGAIVLNIQMSVKVANAIKKYKTKEISVETPDWQNKLCT